MELNTPVYALYGVQDDLASGISQFSKSPSSSSLNPFQVHLASFKGSASYGAAK